jgi:hypothetical protein
MKGQSAIEYLTTYGWMLLVAAIVGVTVFAIIGDDKSLQKVTGFKGEEVQIEDAQLSDDGKLAVEVRATTPEDAKNINISLKNKETGKTVYSQEELDIESFKTKSTQIPYVQSSSEENTYEIIVTYTESGIENQVERGEITGNIKIGTKNTPNQLDSLDVTT